jgi:hypothetical protein
MTAQEIITAAKTILTIPGTGTDTKLLVFLNRAYHHIEHIRPWSWLAMTGVVSTQNKVRQYPLVGDGTYWVRPNSLSNVRIEAHTVTLESVSKEQATVWYPDGKTGFPAMYSASGFDKDEDNAIVMKIYPVPDGVYQVEFEFIKGLSDLALTDTPQMPYILHELLLNCLIWMYASGSDQNKALGITWQGIYQAGLKDAMDSDEWPLETTVLYGAKGAVAGFPGIAPGIQGYSTILGDSDY